MISVRSLPVMVECQPASLSSGKLGFSERSYTPVLKNHTPPFVVMPVKQLLHLTETAAAFL